MASTRTSERHQQPGAGATARKAGVVFLSTSRIYPMVTLNRIAVEETDTRCEIAHRL
jgi:hypothetical protein